MQGVYVEMKRIIALILIALICVGCFCSCKGENKEKDGKISVVTTVFPPYDFARAIGGDKIELTMLVSPGNESHFYEPSVSDMAKITDADLFIYGGGESDEWAKIIVDGQGQNYNSIAMTDCVELIATEENVPDYRVPETDDHVWTTPKNAINIAIEICEALIEISPENTEYFEDNMLTFLEKFTALDNAYKTAIKSAKTKTLVFADRFPFRYLAEEYSLDCHAAFSGCSSEEEAPLSTVKELCDIVKNNNIPVVFTVEFSDGNMAKTICDSTGAKRLTLHSCHTVSKEDFEKGVTYLYIMEKNLLALKEALGSK